MCALFHLLARYVRVRILRARHLAVAPGEPVQLFDATDFNVRSRNFPTWVLLAFGAGCVNAGGFFACQRFVTHLTGTSTRIGMDVGSWTLMAEYGVILLCFMLGAAASVWLLEGRLLRGKPPLPWLPLTLVSSLLLTVAALGHAGVFGPFGQTVETFGDFVMLSLLSFAMGLQNASVATSTGLAVRTTHMTGPTTDLAVALARLRYLNGESRRAALDSAALRGAKLIAFIGGAAVMIPVCARLEYLAFCVPAGVIALATARTFLRVPRLGDRAAAAVAAAAIK